MSRDAYLFSSLVLGTAGLGFAALAALGPWPPGLAVDGQDTLRTGAVAIVLVLTFAALYELAADRLRSLGRTIAPARRAFALSAAFPLALLAYKAAYPLLPYGALWAAASLVGVLAAVAVVVWATTVLRLSRA